MPVLAPFMSAGLLTRLEPVLDALGLVLRPWRPSDARAVVAGYSDPAIRHWHVRSMTHDCEALTWIEGWTQRWQDETGGGWAIAGDDDAALGQISYRHLSLERGAAEISLWMLPAARGNGIAVRALEAVTAWSFDVLGLHRIEINHSTQNTASCVVSERVGYLAEGVKRCEALHADGWHDIHVHSRIATDR